MFSWTIVLVLTLPVHVSSFFIPTIGEVTPNDQYRLVGENFTLYCHLTDSSKNASLLYFEKDSGEVQTNVWLNQSTRTLILQDTVTDVGEYGNFVYYCWVNNTPRNDLVGSQYVHTDYWPQNVTNFNCEVYNWDVIMTCRWQHQVNYIRGIHTISAGFDYTNIRVGWRFQGSTGEFDPCPILTTTSCTWNISSSFDRRDLQIEVEVFNKHRNVSTSRRINVSTKNYVKPSPVESFQSHPVHSTCVQVSWEHDRQFRKKYYRLTYTSKWGDLKMRTYSKDERNVTVRVCYLHPYTTYTFTVEVRAVEGGFWSDKKTTEVQTLEDVPSESPAAHAGSYQYDRQKCQEGNNRKVIFYWQGLDEWYWNGKLTGIEIHVHRVGDPENQFEREQFDSAIRKFGSVLMNCEDEYDIKIYAKNSIGLSVSPAAIRVPKHSKGLIPPPMRVEMPETSINAKSKDIFVRWTPSQVPDVSGYTVFWCTEDVSVGGCEDYIQWKDYGTAEDLPISFRINTSDTVKFGVSTQTVAGISSGLKWETNVYIRDVLPLSEPKNFKMTDIQNHLSLAVQWDSLEHVPGRSPYVEQYIVHYCQVADTGSRSCSGEGKFLHVDGDRQSAVIENLEDDQTYGIWVAAKSEAGEGRESEWVYGKPVFIGLKGLEIAWITIGCVFGFAFAIAGVFFIISCCRKRVTKALTPVPINVPTIIDRDGNDSYSRIEQLDSNSLYSPSDVGKTFVFPNEVKCVSTQRQLSQDSGLGDIESPGFHQKTDPERMLVPVKEEDNDYVRAAVPPEQRIVNYNPQQDNPSANYKPDESTEFGRTQVIPLTSQPTTSGIPPEIFIHDQLALISANRDGHVGFALQEIRSQDQMPGVVDGEMVLSDQPDSCNSDAMATYTTIVQHPVMSDHSGVSQSEEVVSGPGEDCLRMGENGDEHFGQDIQGVPNNQATPDVTKLSTQNGGSDCSDYVTGMHSVLAEQQNEDVPSVPVQADSLVRSAGSGYVTEAQLNELDGEAREENMTEVISPSSSGDSGYVRDDLSPQPVIPNSTQQHVNEDSIDQSAGGSNYVQQDRLEANTAGMQDVNNGGYVQQSGMNVCPQATVNSGGYIQQSGMNVCPQPTVNSGGYIQQSDLPSVLSQDGKLDQKEQKEAPAEDIGYVPEVPSIHVQKQNYLKLESKSQSSLQTTNGYISLEQGLALNTNTVVKREEAQSAEQTSSIKDKTLSINSGGYVTENLTPVKGKSSGTGVNSGTESKVKQDFQEPTTLSANDTSEEHDTGLNSRGYVSEEQGKLEQVLSMNISNNEPHKCPNSTTSADRPRDSPCVSETFALQPEINNSTLQEQTPDICSEHGQVHAGSSYEGIVNSDASLKTSLSNGCITTDHFSFKSRIW